MRVTVSKLAVGAEVGDHTVVMTPDMRFLQLDRIGGEIWELLAAGAQVDEIADELCDRYDIDQQQATNDTVRFVGYLADEGVLEVVD